MLWWKGASLFQHQWMFPLPPTAQKSSLYVPGYAAGTLATGCVSDL